MKKKEKERNVLSDVAESIRITWFIVMYFLALVVACVLPLAAL